MRYNRRDFIKGAALTAGMASCLGRAADGLQAGRQGEIVFSRSLPVKVETDVMVCGGGPAGGSGDVHAVDVKTLQMKLLDFGAYLPNARC